MTAKDRTMETTKVPSQDSYTTGTQVFINTISQHPGEEIDIKIILDCEVLRFRDTFGIATFGRCNNIPSSEQIGINTDPEVKAVSRNLSGRTGEKIIPYILQQGEENEISLFQDVADIEDLFTELKKRGLNFIYLPRKIVNIDGSISASAGELIILGRDSHFIEAAIIPQPSFPDREKPGVIPLEEYGDTINGEKVTSGNVPQMRVILGAVFEDKYGTIHTIATVHGSHLNNDGMLQELLTNSIKLVTDLSKKHRSSHTTIMGDFNPYGVDTYEKFLKIFPSKYRLIISGLMGFLGSNLDNRTAVNKLSYTASSKHFNVKNTDIANGAPEPTMKMKVPVLSKLPVIKTISSNFTVDLALVQEGTVAHLTIGKQDGVSDHQEVRIIFSRIKKDPRTREDIEIQLNAEKVYLEDTQRRREVGAMLTSILAAFVPAWVLMKMKKKK